MVEPPNTDSYRAMVERVFYTAASDFVEALEACGTAADLEGSSALELVYILAHELQLILTGFDDGEWYVEAKIELGFGEYGILRICSDLNGWGYRRRKAKQGGIQ